MAAKPTTEHTDSPRFPARKYESPFMTTAQAAEYLQVSKAYLQRLRVTGDGPIFLKVSARRVLYSLEDIARWLEIQRRRSTVDPGPETSNR